MFSILIFSAQNNQILVAEKIINLWYDIFMISYLIVRNCYEQSFHHFIGMLVNKTIAIVVLYSKFYICKKYSKVLVGRPSSLAGNLALVGIPSKDASHPIYISGWAQGNTPLKVFSNFCLTDL